MLAGNQERAPADLAEDEARGYSVESLIDAAIEGLRLLIRRDRDG
jgi:hypothetical protein